MKNSSSIWTNSVTYGLLTGLVSIIYTLVIYFLDMTFSMPYLNLLISIIIFGIGIYLGSKVLRDQYQAGQLSYGRGLGSGVLIALFAGLLIALFTYILYAIIDPGLTEKSMQYMEDKFLSGGKLSEDQVADMMSKIRERSAPWKSAVWSIPMYVFFGLILSLITSAILKKDPDAFASAMSEVEPEENK
jgi:hypothetical protein